MSEKKYDFSKIVDQQEFEALPEEERQEAIGKAQEEAERVSKGPLREAYALLGASTPLELLNQYTKEDQKLFKLGEWDYENPDFVTNKIKDILEVIDPNDLTEEEKTWRQEILWFWYHHAISCAIALHKDREKAKEYTEKALELQSEDHPNKITHLLYFLANEKIEEAEEWVETISEEPEKTTARELLDEYKKGELF